MNEGRGYWRGRSPELVDATPKALDPHVPLVDARQIARQQGYTGDVCSTCGGVHLQMAGHCMVCADCGTTTGCS